MSFPFAYMGISFRSNLGVRGLRDPILEKISKKLASWKHKQLSLGRRVYLLNSMLNSLSLFYLSLFKIPRKMVNKIVRLQIIFLWRGNEGAKKIA